MPVIRQKRSGNITKSGVITILPKNQIKEIDNLQGTVPIDLSINGHEFIDTSIKFDDATKNYTFDKNYLFDNIVEGVPSIDNFSGSLISSPNSIGTPFSKTALINKKFIKDSRQKVNLVVPYKSFKEENLIATDRQSNFYVSGTSPLIANNFQQSLISRERIEIPISGSNFSNVSSAGFDDAIASSYFVKSIGDINSNFFSYYNFNEKKWTKFKGYISDTNDRTGSLFNDFAVSKASFYTNISNLSIPFSPSTWAKPSTTTTVRYNSGSISDPISSFGFPFSKKFEPFDSNLLKMSNYINKPFYLEKIIFRCNLGHYAALFRDKTQTDELIPLPFTIGTNVFILNNRKVNSKRKTNELEQDSIETQIYSSAAGNKFITSNLTGNKDDDNVRELVTYGKILVTTTGSITLPDDRETASISNIQKQADFYKYVEDNASTNSGIQIVQNELEVDIEIPVRLSFKDKVVSYLHRNGGSPFFNSSDSVIVGNPLGKRTLLGNDLNKSYISNNEVYRNIVESKKDTDFWLFNTTFLTNPVNIYENYDRPTPYILHPEDNLILGLSSFTNLLFENDFKFFTFIKDNAKLILVGTPVNNDRPKFEFDKRFLTSKNLRSSIIGDTFFTDEFDTLPIQFYASSSIDKIVSATGSRSIDRTVSGYYSAGNKGTLLKAVELKNSDIRLTGSLLSEVAHYSYNSYGNFSDLYSQRKYTSYFKIGDNIINYPIEKKFYNQTTRESLHQTGTLSFNSDLNSKITSPFKEA